MWGSLERIEKNVYWNEEPRRGSRNSFTLVYVNIDGVLISKLSNSSQ